MSVQLQHLLLALALVVMVNAQGGPGVTNLQGISNNGFTRQTTISFTVSGSKPSFPKIVCKLDTQGFSTCQAPQTYTGLKDATHILEVRFAQADGTPDGTAATTFTWTVDTVAPSLVFTLRPFPVARPKVNSRTVGFNFDVQLATDKASMINYICSLGTPTVPGPPIQQPCNSKTITYSNLGQPNDDVAYNFSVTATDQAGNSKTIKSDFAIDTKKPNVWLPAVGTSFLTIVPRYTNKTTANFVISTDEPGQVSYLCRRDGVGSFLSCPTKPLAGLPEGEHTMEVQVQDWAGNVQTVVFVSRPNNYTNSFAVNSTTSIFQWRVDTVPPPKPQIPTKPKLQTNIRTPQFSFSVAGSQIGGFSYSCQLSLPGTVLIDFFCYPTTNVASSASTVAGVPVAGLREGPYTLQVQAIDAAGNHGPSNQFNFTIDLSAPKAVLDSTSPSVPSGGITNSPSMTFFFHAVDMFPEKISSLNDFRQVVRDPCPLYNCTMQCSLDGAPLTACTSPITYNGLTPAGQVQPHTFRVVATDNATNVGNSSSEVRYMWTIDRIPPTVSFVTTPKKAEAVDTATFQWRTTEPLTTLPSFRCRLDNGPYYNCSSYPTSGGVFTLVLNNLTHHFNHRFDVEATDFYGNAAPLISYSWQVDLVPPLVTFNPVTWATQGVRLGNPIVLNNGSYTNIRFVDFSFSTEPGSTMECLVDQGAWVSCTGSRRVSSSVDGTHSFRIRATDPVGHVTTIDNQPYWQWILDTVGPTVSYTMQPVRYTNKLNATFVATSTEAMSMYQCEYVSTQFQSGTTSWLPCTNPPFLGTVTNNVLSVNLVQYAFSQTGTQINFVGDHTFKVRAVDLATNIGPTASWTFTVDLTPPSIISQAGQPDVFNATYFRWSRYNFAIFKFQASEIVTYTCTVTPNISWVNPYTPCNAPSVMVNNLKTMGNYTFTVSARDRAGNFDPKLSVRSFSWIADPDVAQTRVIRGPKYYLNTWTSLPFVISTPIPRLRAECTVDRLYSNRTTWLWGEWTECVTRTQTWNGQSSVSYTANVENLLNQSFADPDGIYVFKTRVIDVFGRISPVATYEFFIDTLPPQTALEGTIPYATDRAQLSFTYFTSNPVIVHDYFECQLKVQDSKTEAFSGCQNVVYSCAWSPCGNSISQIQTITGLTVKGTYQFSVRAVDKAGNPDNTPIVTVFKYNPRPANITFLGHRPSKFAAIADTIEFAFAGDEGIDYTCYFSRSDDSPAARRIPIINCKSPVSFAPPPVALQRNGSVVNFTFYALDPHTGASSSFSDVFTLFNQSTLAERVAAASGRPLPVVCTTNNTIYFIVFIVCVVLFILVVIIFPCLILRKMERRGLEKQRRMSSRDSRQHLVPM